MYFWYERSPTGVWCARTSPQSPSTSNASGAKKKLSEVWDVTQFLEDWKGQRPPTLNDLIALHPMPAHTAPVQAEVPAAPAPVLAEVQTGPTLAYREAGGVIELEPSNGLFAEDLKYGISRTPGEAIETWLARLVPKGTRLIPKT